MMGTFLALVVVFVVALVAFDVFAQTGEPARDSWPVLTYLWIAVWASVGGVISFWQKVRAGQARWFNVGELLGEMATSAFVGLITGLLCEAGKFPAPLTWALVGITGHAGGRAIFWLERMLQKVAEKQFGVSVGPIPTPAASAPVARQGTPADRAVD